MEKLNNISLIGMAGCGKSTLGKAISNELGINFVDTDLLIEKKYKATLEEIKIENGYEFVRAAEEEVILSLNETAKIVSTGGSAVYSKKSMQHLKSFSYIIYIETALETIINRIDVGQERGLAVPDGLTIPEVYAEREPLYNQYADFILDGSKSIQELTKLIQKDFF
tara:strand:- start:49 stop:549 length:501 start_codon:yes stop_codon:yes gene_type:complete